MPDILRGLCQVLQWLFVMILFVILCLNVGATAQKSLLIVGGAMSVAMDVTVDGPTPKKREKNKKRWSLSWFSAQLPHSLSRTSRTAIRDATCCAITGAFAYTAYQCLPTLTHQLCLLAMSIAYVLMLEDEDEVGVEHRRNTKKRRKRKREQRRATSAFQVVHAALSLVKPSFNFTIREHEAEMERKHGRWKNESCGSCSDARIRGSADRSRRRLLQVSTKALGSFFYARVPCLMF